MSKKGRKGEKILDIPNFKKAQSPEERECRRESESLGPPGALHLCQRTFTP